MTEAAYAATRVQLVAQGTNPALCMRPVVQEFTVSPSSPVGGPSLSDARGIQVAEPLANFHGWLPGPVVRRGHEYKEREEV